MTTYTFFPDHIQMVFTNSKGYYYFDSTEDFIYIVSSLRADFFLLTATERRASYINCYNALRDIQAICLTSNPDALHIIHLIRDIVSFIPKHNFKYFRLILK